MAKVLFSFLAIGVPVKAMKHAFGQNLLHAVVHRFERLQSVAMLTAMALVNENENVGGFVHDAPLVQTGAEFVNQAS